MPSACVQRKGGVVGVVGDSTITEPSDETPFAIEVRPAGQVPISVVAPEPSR